MTIPTILICWAMKAIVAKDSLNNKIHTKVDNVYIHSSPSIKAVVTAKLETNTTLFILKEENGWVQVYEPLLGKEGWLRKELVEKNNTLPPLPCLTQNPISSLSEKIINHALEMRGSITYRYGSEGSRGSYDCSSWVRYVFGKEGITLPRTAAEQSTKGVNVSRKDLIPGDLIFFHSRISTIGHVGIYIGKDNFVHCSSVSNGINVSNLNEPYYNREYCGARRILIK